MVEFTFGRARPDVLLDLGRVSELREWATEDDGRVRLGSGVSYTRVIADLAAKLPALAGASRTIGSLQIRNLGTVGGNLGTASPAGDAHPALLATNAEIELASVRGTRRLPVEQFFVSPKRSVLEADELITAILLAPASGPQVFSKVGTRNAMVIAVCSFALAIDRVHGGVGAGIGSAGPTPLRAPEAERFLEGVLDESGWDSTSVLDDGATRRFGELVAAAARPIDDVRGTADYRRHALGVLARRALERALAGDAKRAGN